MSPTRIVILALLAYVFSACAPLSLDPPDVRDEDARGEDIADGGHRGEDTEDTGEPATDTDSPINPGDGSADVRTSDPSDGGPRGDTPSGAADAAEDTGSGADVQDGADAGEHLPPGACRTSADCPALDGWRCTSAGTCACVPGPGQGPCDRQDRDCDGRPNRLSACSGACVDLDADPSNCGRCGTVCSAGMTCRGGACACPSGLMACGAGCTAFPSNRERCLYCARHCLAPGAAAADPCCAGACAATSNCGA